MLRQHLIGVDHEMAESDFENIARVTNGYNGSDMLSLSRQAAMAPVRESLAERMDCDNVDAAEKIFIR